MTANARASKAGAKLQLLGPFSCVIDGNAVDLPPMPAALLAHVALAGRSMARRALEQSLWPGLGEYAASKRMRQILWRLHGLTDDRLLIKTEARVSLAPAVEIDWERAEAEARTVALESADREHAVAEQLSWRAFTMALLADHNCSGARAMQMRWNHLRLIALRRLAEASLMRTDAMMAVEFATAAIGIDELSEWPYHVIARAYLDRGDIGLAARVLDDYSGLLRTRFNLSPSRTLRAQIQALETG